MTGRTLVACLMLLCISNVAHAQTIRTLEANEKFANDSWEQLSKSSRVPARELADVRETVSVWRASRSNVDFVKMTEAIHIAAEKGDVKSAVRIIASGGPGATVKYQTLGQRQ